MTSNSRATCVPHPRARAGLLRGFGGVLVIAAAAVAVAASSAAVSRADGLSLDSCLAIAARSNPDVRAADRDIEAARARQRQATALEAPTLSYEFGKLGTPVSAEEREGSIRVSQGLPLPGQRGRAGRVAEVEVEIAKAARESRLLSLQGQVIQGYRRLQADLLTLASLRATQGTVVDLAEGTQARLRTGAAKYLDVLRARTEVARLENDRFEAERMVKGDRQALNTLLARSPDSALEPADSLVFTPLPDSLSALLATARASRPGLRSARLKVEREAAAVSLAKSGGWPSPEFSLGLDRVTGVSQPGIGGGVSLSLPFVPWTDHGAKVQESQAAHLGAEAELESAERSLDRAIRDAYAEAEAAAAQVRSFEQSLLPDAADGLKAATRSFQVGQIDGLELFETIRTYRTVQQEHIRALLNYHLALSDLRTVE